MPNRTLLIAGNWKMNNDVAEAAKLADELAQALPEVPAGVEALVCPPTIDITTVHDRIQAAPIALGAQNVYWEAKGAFTGESSCDMLKSAGCTYCIIGHPSVATTSMRPTRTRTRRPRLSLPPVLFPSSAAASPRGPRGRHLCRARREPGQGWPCWS